MKSRLLKPLPENFSPKRIVLIMTKGMMVGDLLLSTPLIRALKHSYPGAHLAVLTAPYIGEILWGNSLVDEILMVDTGGAFRPLARLFPLYRRLRASDFDLALILCSRTKEVIASFLAGIEFRVGPVTGCLHDYLLNYRFESELNGWSDKSHRVEYLLEYCRVLGNIIPDEEEKLDLYYPLSAEEEITARMKEEGSYELKEPLIIIHPGFSRPSGNLSRECYICLGLSLIKELKAYLMITGPANEYEDTRELIRLFSPRVFDWVGKTDLHTLAALISRASLLIAPNTGTLHMAAAVGTPVIALFSPLVAYSEVWRPYGVSHMVMDIDILNGPGQEKGFIDRVVEGAKSLLNIW